MNKQQQTYVAVGAVVVVVLALAAYFMFAGGGSEDNSASLPPVDPNMGSQPGGPGNLQPGMGQPSTGQPGTGMGAGADPFRAMDSQPKVASAGRPRNDPFAYLPGELESLQVGAYERVGFVNMAQPPEPPKPPTIADQDEPFEPQPYRRIAGILYGPPISAILVDEGGDSRVVKPGDEVGRFYVATIDMSGVTLKRNQGNPREVRVRYEAPQVPTASAASRTGDSGGQPGRTGGGFGGRGGGASGGVRAGAPTGPSATGAGGAGAGAR